MTPGTRLGPYEIIETIGAGGMGAVYRARDTRLARDVAIKMSSARFSDRFDREARVIAALSHSNICTLHDIGPDYLVMELVPGETLADRIARGPIPLQESLAITRQIADALQAAHERGIVHRDLKPANIKLTPDGRVKVLDFGIAKVAAAEAGDGNHCDSPTEAPATQPGEVLGTSAYMAPEQARGDSVDHRADIWALGVVVYEMMTGRRPFQGRTTSDTIAAVLTTEPAWNDLPQAVQRLVRRCLVKDPKRRLRDIGDLDLLLEPAPTVGAPARRSWIAWAVAALLFAALAPLAVTHLQERPEAADPIRFQIPPAVTLAPSGNVALSPDGRHLAFLGVGDDGRFRIYLRTMDSLEVRPLDGSEVAPHAPPFFWSPDSRFIAFDGGGVLKKLNIAGGPAQALCTLAAPVIGGSWNRHGDIILGNVAGGLLRVSENGGAVSPATVPNRARNEDSHLLPTFLPDGRHFVYLRASRGTPQLSGTYIGSLDAAPEAQDPEPLMPYATGMTYVPSAAAGAGHLLYVQEGNLIAQPFDAGRRAIEGEARPLAERVGVYLDGAFFSAARDTIVYRTADPEFPIQWFDRQGNVAGRVSAPGRFSAIALSPMDTQVVAALTNPRDMGNADLWLFDLVRQGPPARFTSFPAMRADFPIWSFDGKRVAFRFPGPIGISVYQKPANAAEEPGVVARNDLGLVTPTSWSPDGRFLIYASTEGASLWDLWVVQLDSATERKGTQRVPFARTRFNEEDGRFSPDGQWVAYVSNESGRDEVYVRRFNPDLTGGSASVGASVPVSTGGGSSPRWRRDGKELFYLAPGGMMMSAAVTSAASLDVQRPVALFQTPGRMTFGGVTADGKRFLLVEQGTAPFTVVLNAMRN
jgi:Tol biopolymer transport system component/tRNA A-37 threonylcarbamoyl transferase component Bud32